MSNLGVADMMTLIGIAAAFAAAVFVAFALRGRYSTPRLIAVESSLMGRSIEGRLKIQMH